MKKLIRSACYVVLSGLMAACATKPPVFDPFNPQNLNDQVSSGRLVQKTENLLVVLDASSSMSHKFEQSGYSADPKASKFAVEKEILSRMNRTIPDIELSSAIRSFGFGSCSDWDRTKLVQPLQSHDAGNFQAGLDSIPCSGGGTPMTAALTAAMDDLATASGKIALLILSDGHDESVTSPALPLQRLINKYGSQLCVYTVWVGNNDEDNGHKFMKSLGNMTNCGGSVDAVDIASAGNMASFVQQLLFAEGEVKVDACALDNDGDGVGNCLDKCPDTPIGADVDETGCWAYHGVLFDFDKVTIKPEFKKMLRNAVKVMKLNPGLTVLIEGHTDSIGREEYNQVLSEKRARAVKEYAINHGIDASRMTIRGYGESQPIESNETEEGRSANRRVVFKRTDR